MSEYKSSLIDNPSHMSQRFFDFYTDGDKIYLVIMASILVLTASAGGNVLLTFTVFAVGLVFLVKFSDRGRLYYDIHLGRKNFIIRRVKHGYIWARPDPSAKNKKLKKGVESSVPVEIYKLGDLGLLHNKLQKTVSCVIVGTGSDIASLSLLSQREMISRYGDNTKRVASGPQFGVGVNYLYRIDPYNPWHLADDRGRTEHPEIYVPKFLLPNVSEEDLTRDDKRRRNLYLNGIEEQRCFLEGVDIKRVEAGEVVGTFHVPGATQPLMAAVVTIKSYGLLKALMRQADLEAKEAQAIAAGKKPSSSRRAKKQQAASEAEAFELPIMDVARTCANGLIQNGVGGVRILDSVGLEAYIRGVMDIANMPKFYEQQHDGNLGPLDHWPSERIWANKTSSVFDDSTFTVIQITNLPSPVPPHFMRLLYALPARWKSVTLVGETIHSTGDYLALGRLGNIISSAMEVFGGTPGIKTNRLLQAISSQQEKVANTKYMHLYNILIGIGQVSTPALKRDVFNVMKELNGMTGVKAKIIKGESLQVPAVWSARGAINML